MAHSDQTTSKSGLRRNPLYPCRNNLSAAEKFRLAFREMSSLLSIAPESGSPRYFDNPVLQGLRFFPLKGFEHYLLLYRLLKDEEVVEIVRIVHGARDLPALFSNEENERQFLKHTANVPIYISRRTRFLLRRGISLEFWLFSGIYPKDAL